jgi:hypothetical protein
MYAASGAMEDLREMADADPRVFRFEDDNGWQVSLIVLSHILLLMAYSHVRLSSADS